MRWVLVALAGAVGSVARFGIGQLVGPRSFPWATLAINLSGSMILGFVLTASVQRHWSPEATTAVTVGLLGAYTTFSTFTNETVNLIRDERTWQALAYVGASVALGMLAAALGIGAAQRWAR